MIAASDVIGIQASIAGFTGKPCTLLSVYDSQRGLLRISKIVDFEANRRDGFLFVSTDTRIDCDAQFSAALLGAAIDAYEAFGARLKIDPDAMRCKPDGQYQTDGFDERGAKRRIDDGLSNEKVSALATCWSITKQDAIEGAILLMDAVSNQNRIGAGMGADFDVYSIDTSYPVYTI